MTVEVLAGGGDMGARMRATDWSTTPLGPVDSWPQALKTCLRIILTSRQPMFVWWGDDLINLYNDAYRDILGGKHPWALGQPAEEVWAEIWDQVGPRARSAMLGNEGTYDEALLLIMERHGYPEETYYTFSYSPVPNDEGGTGGIFCANTNDTDRIISERRLALLRELAAGTADARTVDEAWAFGARALATDLHDLPFALIYRVEKDGDSARLVGASNIEPGHPAAPLEPRIDDDTVWPLGDLIGGSDFTGIDPLPPYLATLPPGAWDRSPQAVVVLPIAPSSDAGGASILIAGLNPYRPLDADYRRFLDLITRGLAGAIVNARAYQEERSRAEALAELDRAKTAFFSNVSHEFRTPLTLLLAPLEDVLNGNNDFPASVRDSLQVAHRNALRLLRLVNTLLDFSRIEAGRVQASYVATDLPAYTTDLASTFRSAMERAGLRYLVDCPPLPDGISTYVDHDMWEKIVLNLLSNAFKFTLDGEITVRLRLSPARDTVTLEVGDTGTGISADELPRLFERFHRVQGATARTQEGTGIGLALVHELVKLHGGTVNVVSALGRGTTFFVTLPTGTAHLPADRIEAPSSLSSTATGAAPYVGEALRWLPGAGPGTGEIELSPQDIVATVPPEALPSATRGGRVVVADDNADMREYVARLLGQHFEVIAVPDGQAALDLVAADPPDLVLSDVMMPHLDGFGLLRALRSNPQTQDIPVILLSARAGEEARVEGLDAGADDYLVKPFVARELLARVGTHLALARVRREATRKEQHARAEADAAVRARDEFLSIASHELRTPVTVIKGVAQMLQRLQASNRLDPDRLNRQLETITKATDRLTVLVSDLLDVSRLQSGQFILRPTILDLAVLLREVVDRRIDSLPEGYVLEVQLPPGPVWVEVDATRIEQILDNLVDNAIKYSPAGGTVTLSLQGGAGAVLRVVDRGIGLPDGAAGRIFEPFGRASNAVLQNLPGLGLGLYVGRRIAELHGGHLGANSAGENQGTTFELWLPERRAADATSAPEPTTGHITA